MHEASLMKDLMAKILKVSADNDARQVERVHIWLGALSHISKDHFIEHFIDASRGSIAEGAQVSVTTSSDMQDPRAMDILLESVDLKIEP